MEAPKTAPPQSQNLPPSQPPMNRKRPLDISKSQNSPYNKMRLIVKDLRPHVIETELDRWPWKLVGRPNALQRWLVLLGWKKKSMIIYSFTIRHL
ncbi:hypothetical protein MTR67_024260 [Solanum verrucosum]|uniref:Uncharacterized protein n=1 Tax=Solanum verrucosum TaxID=315347 RepID=A0AAF0QY42_SOLVR|nr:hypothetical protein MTR67_024260 [Solanum verrucosum]